MQTRPYRCDDFPLHKSVLGNFDPAQASGEVMAPQSQASHGEGLPRNEKFCVRIRLVLPLTLLARTEFINAMPRRHAGEPLGEKRNREVHEPQWPINANCQCLGHGFPKWLTPLRLGMIFGSGNGGDWRPH